MSEIFKDRKRVLYYLIVSNLLMAFGFQIWQTLFNNFAVEKVGIGPAGIGLIQAVREVPGLMGFLLGFLALYFSEVRIMAVSVILLGVGMVATGFSANLPILLVSTVVMSFGFHFFSPSSNAVVLMVVEPGDAPKILGRFGSLGAIAAVAATAAVFFLAKPWGYTTLFLVVGVLVIAGGFLLLPAGRVKDTLPQKRRVVLRKRYWLYYSLSFLMGSRRHIFTTFAILLLVRNYGISVQTTAILFLVNSLINVYALPAIGQLIGRLGERWVLSAGFALLALIFLGYAYISSLPLLFGLFVADNILFGISVGITTYFQKIAVTPEEITSNLSVEQATNHIAAIVVPVIGGTVWELFGSQAPFLFGIVIVLLALLLAQFIRTPGEATWPTLART